MQAAVTRSMSFAGFPDEDIVQESETFRARAETLTGTLKVLHAITFPIFQANGHNAPRTPHRQQTQTRTH